MKLIGHSIIISILLLFYSCTLRDKENNQLIVATGNSLVDSTIFCYWKNILSNEKIPLHLQKQIIIGTTENCTILKHMVNFGHIKPEEIKHDGFQVFSNDSAFIVAGNTESGSLNGTIMIHKGVDWIKHEAIDTVINPFFIERVGGVLDGGSQWYPGCIDDDTYAEWLARHFINYNGLHKGYANLKDSSAAKFNIHLYAGGSANIFFNANDSSSIKQMQQWKKSYHTQIVNSEPNSNSGKSVPVLCIKSSFGKKQHVKKISEIVGTGQVNRLLFTFGDWGSVCGPECPRCGQDPLWKRISDWLTIISEISNQVKPGTKVIGRTWYFTSDIIDSLITNVPSGIGVRVKEPTGIILEKPRGSHALEQDNYSDVMLIKREMNELYGSLYKKGPVVRGEDFYGATGIGDTGESTDPVIGIATPFITAFKMRRLAELEIKNFCIWWGGLNPLVYSVNHEVISEMIWNPFQDPDSLIFNIAKRDFPGKENEVFVLWQTIDHAFSEWKYINWQQQFEEFVARSDELIYKSFIPENIIDNNWVKKMWPNKDLLIDNEKEVLIILRSACEQAKEIHDFYQEDEIDIEIEKRSYQQYIWLKLYTCIMQAQYNVFQALELMENNGSTEKWIDFLMSDIKNTSDLIETIKDINYPKFRMEFHTPEEELEYLNDKIIKTREFIQDLS